MRRRAAFTPLQRSRCAATRRRVAARSGGTSAFIGTAFQLRQASYWPAHSNDEVVDLARVPAPKGMRAGKEVTASSSIGHSQAEFAHLIDFLYFASVAKVHIIVGNRRNAAAGEV